MFTQDAAYAAFDEKDRGTIAVGMRADLTVLGADLDEDRAGGSSPPCPCGSRSWAAASCTRRADTAPARDRIGSMSSGWFAAAVALYGVLLQAARRPPGGAAAAPRLLIASAGALGIVASVNFVVNPFGTYAPHVFEPMVLHSRADKLHAPGCGPAARRADPRILGDLPDGARADPAADRAPRVQRERARRHSPRLPRADAAPGGARDLAAGGAGRAVVRAAPSHRARRLRARRSVDAVRVGTSARPRSRALRKRCSRPTRRRRPSAACGPRSRARCLRPRTASPRTAAARSRTRRAWCSRSGAAATPSSRSPTSTPDSGHTCRPCSRPAAPAARA